MRLVHAGCHAINMDRVDYWTWVNAGDNDKSYVVINFGDHALTLDVKESDEFWSEVEEGYGIAGQPTHVMVHFPHSDDQPNALNADVKVHGVVGTYTVD